MAKSGLSASGWTNVDVEYDVDLTVQEVFDGLTEEGKIELSSMLGYKRSPGDHARTIESAFLSAKSMPDCPQALKDLFWHVHGLAM